MFPAWNKPSLSDSEKLLQSLETLIKKNSDSILQALNNDLGKPKLEAYLSEVFFSISEIRGIRKNFKKWLRTRKVGTNFFNFPAKSFIQYEPFGSVLVLSPWNYPFALAMVPAAAALAGGNNVIIKPSEFAPHTSDLLWRMAQELRDKRFNVVLGDHHVAEKLLTDKPDYVFFTGSTSIGTKVMQQCAAHLVPLTLELGGKSPCIVLDDANLDHAARRIALGKFFNAGQTCIAPDFVCVHESQHDHFIELVLKYLRTWYATERSLDQSYAKIVHERHFTRLESLVSDRAIQIGLNQKEKLLFVPTLLPRTRWDEACMQEEIFGPILPIIPYLRVEELFTRLKNTQPLALYVFSKTNGLAQRCIQEIPSGTVCVNDVMMQITNPKLPFGGIGRSGFGRSHAEEGVRTFVYSRGIMKKPSSFDLFGVYPPYDRTFSFIKRWVK